jgi:membrane-bound metal-dependent hydrolase YbcI (DUF457 family)
MFIGHYAVSFAAKRLAPEISMGILVFAANFPDIIWSIAIILGIENAHIASDSSVFTPVGLNYYAISHSFVVSIVLSVLFANLYWWKKKDVTGALVIGGAGFSHWLLDFVTAPSTLPLFPGSSMNLGLGLLSSMTSRLLVEELLLVIGVLLYLSITKLKKKIKLYGFATFVLLISATYIVSNMKQIEFGERLLGEFVVFTLVLPVWAQWFDENSETERAGWGSKLATIFNPLFFNSNKDSGLSQESRPSHRTSSGKDLYNPGEGSGGKAMPEKPSKITFSRSYADSTYNPELRSHREKPESQADNKKKNIESQAETIQRRRVLPATLIVILLLALTAIATYLLFNFEEPEPNKKQPSAEKIKQEQINKAIAQKPEEIQSALRESTKLSKDVEQILLEKWEDKNIGGAIAVSTANWQSNDRYKTYQSIANLGFQRINKPEALVNQVLNNNIRIDHMELIPALDATCSRFTKFTVSITLTNLTQEPQDYYIPVGQLIEVKSSSPVWKKAYTNDNNKDYTNNNKPEKAPQTTAKSQNPDKSKNNQPYSIPPADTDTIYFDAYCVDEGLEIPYGPANLAIFEVINKNFESQKDLHNIINGIRSGTKQQALKTTSLRGKPVPSILASVP